ncbi:lactoylglutathione lyase [Weissella oryzae SG25]|uniref:Lactoylglutathione lyase n=1 Tax=Weissella oryzae (strain DSM 25784 / JCM 18191 / LMG 30913 / SG25) TaxID=1329250 RepID=A0A069CT78_WEIOS|nr:lactoylglutathione lyase [Weissella oryzae]GAK30612.1 lactoylglutathione lyase [Weissella oryzae SG25]
MRVRKFSPKYIPSKNLGRAVRFYREVFDLPTEFGEHEDRHLFFNQEAIVFDEVEAEPITVTVVVRDHESTVEKHLINYYVQQSAPVTESADGKHVTFHLDDFEGNHIEVIANK